MKKKMKKILSVLVIVLIAVACEKEEGSNFDYDINQVYGKWRVTHVKSEIGEDYLDVTTSVVEQYFEPTYITFNKNGSYSGSGFFGSGSGTFKAEGKSITTYIDGEIYLVYTVISFSNSNFEVIMSSPEEATTMYIKGKKI
jgi:uncharacterized protein YxeA